jgi:hypothetical protein
VDDSDDVEMPDVSSIVSSEPVGSVSEPGPRPRVLAPVLITIAAGSKSISFFRIVSFLRDMI